MLAAISAPSSIPTNELPCFARKFVCCSIAPILTVIFWIGKTHRTRNSPSNGWTSSGTLLHSSRSSHTRLVRIDSASCRKARAISEKFRLRRSVPRRTSRSDSRLSLVSALEMFAPILGFDAIEAETADELTSVSFFSPSRETSTSPDTPTVVIAAKNSSRCRTNIASVSSSSSSRAAPSKPSCTSPSRSARSRAARSVGETVSPMKRPSGEPTTRKSA